MIGFATKLRIIKRLDVGYNIKIGADSRNMRKRDFIGME